MKRLFALVLAATLAAPTIAAGFRDRIPLREEASKAPLPALRPIP